ncbi:MAG: hypothetical protein KGV56_05660 [Gammaproteobacteria bacterium]|nr:hypothetical protein [Gammaproteobacteria bacterium]
MSAYNNDRCFTDYVFNHLAKPIIYPHLGWKEYKIDPHELESLDIHNGIDTLVHTSFNQIKAVQYRFRDNFYQHYNDVTLRYKREHNSNADRINSEFFKIEAQYLMYGITNGKKFNDALMTNTHFVKWAIVDILELQRLINEGCIIIDPELGGVNCKLTQNDEILCPIIPNKDDSSSFVPFDIHLLNKVSNGAVVVSFGYTL